MKDLLATGTRYTKTGHQFTGEIIDVIVVYMLTEGRGGKGRWGVRLRDLFPFVWSVLCSPDFSYTIDAPLVTQPMCTAQLQLSQLFNGLGSHCTA